MKQVIMGIHASNERQIIMALTEILSRYVQGYPLMRNGVGIMDLGTDEGPTLGSREWRLVQTEVDCDAPIPIGIDNGKPFFNL